MSKRMFHRQTSPITCFETSLKVRYHLCQYRRALGNLNSNVSLVWILGQVTILEQKWYLQNLGYRRHSFET